MTNSGRRLWLASGIIALALLPGALVAWRFRDMPQFGAFHDDGIYWVSAQSIAQRGEYRIPSLPGAPSQTKYPPLYPLFLAPVWALNSRFPANLPIAALLTWLWLPVFAFLSWKFFLSLNLGEWQSALLASVAVLLPQTLLHANRLMSDIMFACLLLVSLRLLAAAGGHGLWRGVAAGLAYLTRTAAAPLLLVVPVWLLCQRRYRAAAAFLAGALPFLAGWHLWCAAHRSASSDEVTIYYTDYLRYQLAGFSGTSILERIANNFGYLLSAIARLLAVDSSGSFLEIAAQRVMVAAAIAGIVRLGRSGRAVPYALFAALYTCQVLVWRFEPNPRFLFCLLPLLLAGLWVELARVGRLVRSSLRHPPAANRVVAALFLAVLLWMAWLFARQARWEYARIGPAMLRQQRGMMARTSAVYDWIATHVAPGAVFFAINDPALYLYTGRHALRCADLNDIFARDRSGRLRPTERLLRFVEAQKVSHVLVTANDFETPAGQGLKLALEGTNWVPLFEDGWSFVCKTSAHP